MTDRVDLRHADPTKQVRRIRRDKDEQVRAAILSVLRDRRTVHVVDLDGEVAARLSPSFEASVGWYTTAVKLDLEARCVIARGAEQRRQVLQLDEGMCAAG
ncbi:MAG: hypothetical protein KatS3mg060_1024 [Dehalococcoidia bacterium]|nr:MAG: hypothetical protein KatS3mg060_1024 [Dehalococcoidia bacterium]